MSSKLITKIASSVVLFEQLVNPDLLTEPCTSELLQHFETRQHSRYHQKMVTTTYPNVERLLAVDIRSDPTRTDKYALEIRGRNESKSRTEVELAHQIGAVGL